MFWLLIIALLTAPATALDQAVSASCPTQVLLAPTETEVLVSAINADGSRPCVNQLVLTLPDNTTSSIIPSSCANGLTRFAFNVTQNGKHAANATLGSVQSSCSFAVLGQPPRAVAETSLFAVLLSAFLAYFLANNKKQQKSFS